MTREELSTLLDRFELWMMETANYHASHEPYVTSCGMTYAREQLFLTLVEALRL